MWITITEGDKMHHIKKDSIIRIESHSRFLLGMKHTIITTNGKIRISQENYKFMEKLIIKDGGYTN